MTDAAWSHPRRTLRVEDQRLVSLHGRCERGRGVITLDVVAIGSSGEPPARIWAHEVGHYFDPDNGLAPTARKEQWADECGDVLLYHLPTTLAEAEPLIRRLDDRRPPLTVQPGRDWPDEGLEEADSVVMFHFLLSPPGSLQEDPQ